jgi:hypothetical protein
MNTIDIIKAHKKIYMSESSLETIIDFERVLDELDMYAFSNWIKGELVEGPVVSRHWVEATFMWPHKQMPDPAGAKRLLQYDAIVEYSKDKLNTPIKVEQYKDFDGGTKMPKMKSDPVWLVKISLPAEIIKDYKQGFVELEGQEIDLSTIDKAYDEDLHNDGNMESQLEDNQ